MTILLPLCVLFLLASFCLVRNVCDGWSGGSSLPCTLSYYWLLATGLIWAGAYDGWNTVSTEASIAYAANDIIKTLNKNSLVRTLCSTDMISQVKGLAVQPLGSDE